MLPWYEGDRFWAMLENQLFNDDKKKAAIEDAFTHRIFSAAELKQLLEQ